MVSIAVPGEGKITLFISDGTVLRSAPVNIHKRQRYLFHGFIQFADPSRNILGQDWYLTDQYQEQQYI
jgi:hypothetical protein